MAREEGIALSLSGGGYRAMVYHLGALIRLQELGLLTKLSRISSVSGGSITAGALARAWPKIVDSASLIEHVVRPVRALASETIDRPSILGGLFLPGSVGDWVADRYDALLFKGATLQDLPDTPRFVFNATNLETGTLWRFSKPYMRDYKVGRIDSPKLRLAEAVAASSAFPPVLSPFILKVAVDDFAMREPGVADGFFEEVTLTDGGVYDNYGLEPIWDRYTHVLVSDGGGMLAPDPRPNDDWGQQTMRVIDVIQQQVHALRSRQLIEAYDQGGVKGCLWSIQTPLSAYKVPPVPSVADARVAALAQTPTRLKKMSATLQEQLINLGYLGCASSIGSWYLPDGPPAALPYPASGV